MMYNAGMSQLPLFPLNTVLFPGQMLPLHIFEPRYRQMIGECVERGTPFGVVLIRDGDEVGDPNTEPYDVGTTAHIVQVERLEDGRLNIICVGNSRFRIQRTLRDHDYLRGEIELWPWLPYAAQPDEQQMATIRSRLDRYVKLLAEITQTDIQVDVPTEPAKLANIAASVLQIETEEKQQLLTTASIGDLLEQVSPLLQRELRALQIMHGSRQKPPEELTSFSMN